LHFSRDLGCGDVVVVVVMWGMENSVGVFTSWSCSGESGDAVHWTIRAMLDRKQFAQRKQVAMMPVVR